MISHTSLFVKHIFMTFTQLLNLVVCMLCDMCFVGYMCYIYLSRIVACSFGVSLDEHKFSFMRSVYHFMVNAFPV